MAGKTYKRTEIEAYGKINLSLDIKGLDSRRYHLLETIMQTVPVSDSVVVTSTVKGGTPPKNVVLPYKLPITLTTDVRGLPSDSRNTAYKAAELMLKTFPHILGAHEDISINIKKRIPVGGGLGGSSADCAAVIKAFNTHFELGLDDARMAEIGAKLGSDVPFMMTGGTALVTGTGEIVEKLPAPDGLAILLCWPGFGMDTWEVYRKYDTLAIDPEARPDTGKLLEALKAGDNAAFASGLKNVLEIPAFSLKNELSRLKTRLGNIGALNVLMSGSGSSFICIFKKESEAKAAMQPLLAEGLECLTFRI